MFLRSYNLKKYSFLLLISALLLAVIGVLVIHSAVAGTTDADIYTKQIMGIGIGLAVCIFLSMVDYHLYIRFFPVVYVTCCLLLLFVLLKGEVHGGAKRWLRFPVIGQIQPSEFSKIFLILSWAGLFTWLDDRLNKPWAVGVTILFSAVPLGLIFKEPDLSTTIACGLIFVTMIYVAKISYKWILGVLAVLIPSGIGFTIFLLKNEEELVEKFYMVRRIMAFLNPKKYADLYYQQENSMMAIGSGGLFGKGLNNTTFESVKNGHFLSEAQTDFIFAVVGEELGFAGAIVILGLTMTMIVVCLNIARQAKDLSGRLICCGYAALLAFQTFINVCVATGMMPNTGIPFPFVSYGLSSLLAMFIGLGIVLNVGLQRGGKY